MIVRIVLTNNLCCPTREELGSLERTIGELIFDGYDLEWGGFIAENDTFKLSAQWLCETSTPDTLVALAKTRTPKYHTVSLYSVEEDEIEELKLA